MEVEGVQVGRGLIGIEFSEVSLTDFVRRSVFFLVAVAGVSSWCPPLKGAAAALKLLRLGRSNSELLFVSLLCVLVLE